MRITQCLVWTMGLLGKHQAHPEHVWWYTSYGGGHQLNDISDPDRDWDDGEGFVTRHTCPGRP